MSTAIDTPDEKPGKTSLTHQAYETLRRLILDNELKPGRRMLEQELADFLKMSRTPVREATIRLANEGLVDVRPRHGMLVLPISPEDMREIYDVLTSLEASAAEMVATAGLPKSGLDRLNTAIDEMDAALDTGDREAWARADEEFHRLLVSFSGNKRLITLVEGMWDQAHRARMVTLAQRPLPTASNAEHRALVRAIRDGNAERARRIHTDHRRKARDLIVGLLGEMGLA